MVQESIVIFYKIRNKNTGEFSKGGLRLRSTGDVTWGKKGKTWDTLGTLRSHLNQHLGNSSYGYKQTDMSHWEVVEYHVVEQPAKGVDEVLAAKTIVKMLTK
jgi:hypothetical protein